MSGYRTRETHQEMMCIFRLVWRFFVRWESWVFLAFLALLCLLPSPHIGRGIPHLSYGLEHAQGFRARDGTAA